MNKLTTLAAAALLAGSACAVTSSNIVGYQRYELAQGYNFYTATFDALSGNLDIQDLVIEGSEGWATEMIYGLDADGLLTGEDYNWNNPENAGLDHWAWIDVNGAEAVKTIKAGEAVYLYADSEGLSFTLPSVIPAK